MCDLDSTWGVELYQLEDSGAPLPRMSLDPVSVLMFSGCTQIWPPVRNRRASTKRSSGGASKEGSGGAIADHADEDDGTALMDDEADVAAEEGVDLIDGKGHSDIDTLLDDGVRRGHRGVGALREGR